MASRSPTREGATRTGTATSAGSSDMTILTDAFGCRCTFCRNFWDQTFGPLKEAAASPTLERAVATSSMFRKKGLIKVGDRVIVNGEHKGVVKFVGLVGEDFMAPKTYVGVKLDDNINSRTNGTYKNKFYFHCPVGHGVIVPYTQVRQLNPPDERPPIYGNEMFPSWETVKLNRRLRQALESELVEVRKSGKVPTPDPSQKDPGEGDSVSSRPTTASILHQRLSNRNTTFGKEEGSTTQFRRRLEQRHNDLLRAEFGGGQRAETLLKTLQKLQTAYELGREYIAVEQQSYLPSNGDMPSNGYHRNGTADEL